MAELTDAAIDAALERGRLAHAQEPRAAAARYDRTEGMVTVDLENGCVFAFPPRLVAGLDGQPLISLPRSGSWAWVMACIGKNWMWICRCPG